LKYSLPFFVSQYVVLSNGKDAIDPHVLKIKAKVQRTPSKVWTRQGGTPLPPQIIASAHVFGIGTGKIPGCLTSEEVPFGLAKSHCQGQKTL
jgi:hypothetical protein